MFIYYCKRLTRVRDAVFSLSCQFVPSQRAATKPTDFYTQQIIVYMNMHRGVLLEETVEKS